MKFKGIVVLKFGQSALNRVSRAVNFDCHVACTFSSKYSNIITSVRDKLSKALGEKFICLLKQKMTKDAQWTIGVVVVADAANIFGLLTVTRERVWPNIIKTLTLILLLVNNGTLTSLSTREVLSCFACYRPALVR